VNTCGWNKLTDGTLLVAGINDGRLIACAGAVGTTAAEGPFLIAEIEDGDGPIAPPVAVGTTSSGLAVGGTTTRGPRRHDMTAASGSSRRGQDMAIVVINNSHIDVGCGERN
jgi:hypothetical protein